MAWSGVIPPPLMRILSDASVMLETNTSPIATPADNCSFMFPLSHDRRAETDTSHETRSRIHDLLICRRWHARLPVRVTQLDAIIARIEHKKLSASEKSPGAIIHGLVDLNAEITKDFAGLNKHFRADIESVVQAAVLFDGANQRFFSLA